jgi:hypothetical protein
MQFYLATHLKTNAVILITFVLELSVTIAIFRICLRNMEILYRISPEEKIQMFTHDERQVMANAHMAWPGEVSAIYYQ